VIRPRELSLALQLFPALTPTLPPATHTNSYALGSRELLLVEPATPYEDEQRAFCEWARALGSTGRRALAIVATHHHPDHVGGLDVLSRELSLPVWAHAGTKARLSEKLAQHVVRELDDGELLPLDGPVPQAWRVLHTPGHAPGHVCLHEESEKTLIVGDMVASQGSILIARGDGDMKVYLEQLRRLESLGARLALPAHGEPIDEPGALFHRYVEHRLMREKMVLGAIQRGGGRFGPDELLPEAYGDTPKHLWPLALLSLEAHLDKLVADGVVSQDSSGRFRLVVTSN
jgi:ribonuclease/clavin/mitogillin